MAGRYKRAWMRMGGWMAGSVESCREVGADSRVTGGGSSAWALTDGALPLEWALTSASQVSATSVPLCLLQTWQKGLAQKALPMT